MKPREFLNHFKTKTGKIIVFGAIFAAGLVIFGVLRKQHTPAEDAIPVTPLGTNTTKPQVVQSVVRPMQKFNPQAASAGSSPSKPASAFTNASPQPLPVVPPRQAVNLGARRDDQFAAEINIFSDQADDGRLDGSRVHRGDGLAWNQPSERSKYRAQFLGRRNPRRTVGKQTDGRKHWRLVRGNRRRRRRFWKS